MQLSAVNLARTVAFLQLEDLNPRNRVSLIDFAKRLTEQYKFLKSPQTVEDLDPVKGIEFLSGKLNETNIERFTLFLHGIVVDTRSSTEDSDIVLQNALRWNAEVVGLDSPVPIVNKSYVSQLTFYSDLSLPAMHPALRKLASRITESISRNMGHPFEYEVYSINLNFDFLTAKYAPGPFTIERRQDVPFPENKYFSTSPVSTSEHISFLEEFEAALKAHL